MATLTERLHHLVLPAYTLSLLRLGQVTLHARESIASVMKSEFICPVRSQGDKGWSLLCHQVLRHAITPTLCLQSASLGELLGGALLARKVFAYPGLGQAAVDVGLHGDLSLLARIVLFSAALVFINNSLFTWLVRMLNRTLEQPDTLQPDANANSPFVLFQLPVIHYDIWCRNIG